MNMMTHRKGALNPKPRSGFRVQGQAVSKGLSKHVLMRSTGLVASGPRT